MGLNESQKLCGTFYIFFWDLLFSAIVTSEMTLAKHGFLGNCTVAHPVITDGPLVLPESSKELPHSPLVYRTTIHYTCPILL